MKKSGESKDITRTDPKLHLDGGLTLLQVTIP